jgi:hypothetical protein
VASLGSAGSYGLLEDGGNVSIGSFFILSSQAKSNGEVGLGNSTVNLALGSALSVNGTLTLGNVNFTGLGKNNVSATTTITSSQSTIDKAWSDAKGASASYSAMSPTASLSGNSISASGAVTVVDVKALTSDLTIHGGAGQVFVINVTGAQNGNSINLKNITLTGGVTASTVVFNVTGNGNIKFNGGTVNGTFVQTGSGAVSITGTTLNGAVITSSNLSTSGKDSLNAAPLNLATVSAPELPSVAMAGVACLLVFGRAGLGRIKRRHAA